MKRLNIRRDLGMQILVIYALLVTPIVIAIIAFASFSNERLESDVKAADLALARAIAQDTDITLKNSLAAIREIGTSDGVIKIDKDEMHDLFRTVMSVRPDINLIYRLDQLGFMVFHYPTGPGSTIGDDFSYRNYFQSARVTSRPLISKGRISPTTNQPVATAVMPLWDTTGHFLGVVATNIKLESLSQKLVKIANEYRHEEEFQVVIIDSSGKIIADPNPEIILDEYPVTTPNITEKVLLGRSGNDIGESSSGNEILYSYVPVTAAGWGVIVGRPTASAFATARAFLRGVLAVLGIFLFVSLTSWFGLMRQIIRPMGRLANFSRIVGIKGDISHTDRLVLEEIGLRQDQVGHLTRSLLRMEAAVNARYDELATLLETSAEVVSSLEPQIVLNRILEQVERLMDVERSSIVALDENLGVFRAQASRGLSMTYAQQLAIDPSEPMSITLRAIRTKKPIQISDIENEPSLGYMKPRARKEGYRSVLAVPLKYQHSPPSALLVYRPDPHEYSEREINLLSNFANQAAMAIENATLYSRSDTKLQEQTRRIEALIQSMHEGLVLENLEGKIIYANRRISELTLLPLDEIIGSSTKKLIRYICNNAIDPGKTESDIKEAISSQGDQFAEIALSIEGRVRYLRLQAFDVTDSNGISIGHGHFLHDVTADRELDRMKSSLISTVSHELRTPLASIKGYATTLLADDVEWDTGSQREFLEIISKETDRLSDLVNDLLDLSRIEAGSLTVTRIKCDLRELITNAANGAQTHPGNRLILNIPENLPYLYADERRMETVLRNLIDNATKYSGDNNPIVITASFNHEELIIKVEDQGPGIPEDQSEKIFESFYRLENGLTRSAPGAGLGLAICQGFVNAHGGDIWVEQCDHGACIAFSLPLINVFADPATPHV